MDIGNNATFTCTASGEPVPAISWQFGDTTFSSGDKYIIVATGETPGTDVDGGAMTESMLTVVGVDAGDEGTYSCVATNDHGSVADSASLQPLRKCVCVCVCACGV